jgi:hypothetical protein
MSSDSVGRIDQILNDGDFLNLYAGDDQLTAAVTATIFHYS